jgi:hypothetical protein
LDDTLIDIPLFSVVEEDEGFDGEELVEKVLDSRRGIAKDFDVERL